MIKFKEILEKIKGSEDFSDLKSATARDFLNGDIFLKNFFKKQYLLLLLIAVLTFCYIGYHYACEKQLKEYAAKREQLTDSKYEWLTVFAEFTTKSRQSNIRKSVDNELKESKVPAIILEQR